MRNLAFFLSLLIPLTANALPPTFSELAERAASHPSLRFEYREVDTSGPHTVIDGEKILMKRTTTASISETKDGKRRVQYEEVVAGQSWDLGGEEVTDGEHTYSVENRGKQPPRFISKRPVSYMEDYQKQILKLRPEQKHLLPPKDNCGRWQRLYGPNSVGWSPFTFYEKLKDREISSEVVAGPSGEKIHHWSVKGGGRCSRLELWIRDDGLLTRFQEFNPTERYSDYLWTEGEFTEIEVDPDFKPETFTFDQSQYPNARIMEIGGADAAQRIVNTFATPPEKIFRVLFHGEPGSVDGLKGSGHSWFSSDYHLRFQSASLPKWRKQPELRVSGTNETALEFFQQRFPSDKDALGDVAGLSFQSFDQEKQHWWVVQHAPSKTFFIRYWTDE